MARTRIEEVRGAKDALALFGAVRRMPYRFFLDGQCGDARLGRFSFLGGDPFLVMTARRDRITLAWQGGRTERFRADPFAALAKTLGRFEAERDATGIPFTGGAVGYLSYDLKDFIEKLPRRATDDLRIPDFVFGFYDTVIIHDHHLRRTFIASSGLPENGTAARKRRQEARLRAVMMAIARRPRPERWGSPPRAKLVSTFTPSGYRAAVMKAKEHIRRGDIYQVNLSQRFSARLAMRPDELYRRLRTVSPAPFSAYLGFGALAVASSSPERFLLKRGDRVETCPIKGTRPRGEDAFSDMLLEKELSASPKDRAEHVMIVDLERNDLGRIAQYGSVRPSRMASVERYANVLHLVSTVRGRLRPGIGPVGCLRAVFPGGSITGAPKIRAMEIIDELEPVRRSIYTGAIGYISFGGNIDLSIAIRTFIVKGGRAYFSVGGGIVADSDPAAEYRETLDKAKGMFEALGIETTAGARHGKDLA